MQKTHIKSNVAYSNQGDRLLDTEQIGFAAPLTEDNLHSTDIDDIITTVPSWLLRWGITLFFCVILLMICLSAMIRYPDVVRSQLKVSSPNSPKPIVAKISGKIVALLVDEGKKVKTGQPLAYLESTAKHQNVMTLLSNLKSIQSKVIANQQFTQIISKDEGYSELGELQSAYQSFYQEFINYASTIGNGFMLKKRTYLQKDLLYLSKQREQLAAQSTLQKRDFSLAESEFDMHRKLEQARVETKAEFREQEGRFLARKSSLLQMEISMINIDNNYDTKRKDILEVENQLQEVKAKFLQSINSLISSAEEWKSKYVLTASQGGDLSFVGVIQQNQVVVAGQEIFYIDPGNLAFFGLMEIPQDNMGKVIEGQEVLIKLKSFPFEQYGIIEGKISYLAKVAYKDSVFISKVNFKIHEPLDQSKVIQLKQGMIGNAEIITQDASVLDRLIRNVTKNFTRN